MSNTTNVLPANIDFHQDGANYQAQPMDLADPSGQRIYIVRPYGKRGGLLKKHRPAICLAGFFKMSGAWIQG